MQQRNYPRKFALTNRVRDGRTRLFGAGRPGSIDSLPRERLWLVRAASVVLATGAVEQPLIFSNNDRPGIMLASAALSYLHRHAVMPGRRAVLFADNDDAYAVAAAQSAANDAVTGAAGTGAPGAGNLVL